LQPADDGFYDAALLFKRADALQVHISRHYADYHNYDTIYLLRHIPAIKNLDHLY
jgi:ribosomal protein S15P/S13E